MFATVFAKAVAEAAATAQCFANGGDAAATAFILAEVGADVYEYEACYIGIEETGPADGFVGNSGTATFVVRVPCSIPPLLYICALLHVRA